MKVKVDINHAVLKDALQKAGRRGIQAALDCLARESKKQVPLDEGPLKDSCMVSVEPDGSEGVVSYDTAYAVRWHEQDANFQRGRKKKYLEDPANDGGVQAEMLRILQSEIQKQIGD